MLDLTNKSNDKLILNFFKFKTYKKMEETYLDENFIPLLLETTKLPLDIIKYVICPFLEVKVYKKIYKDRTEWVDQYDRLHREEDKPAVEWNNGSKRWYKEGKNHREGDLPANEWSDGTKEWYKEEKQHREDDLPAVEYIDGSKHWYKEGKLHREGDLPSVENKNGHKEWWYNGELHREGDLPAIVYIDGTKLWYKEGKLQRR